jgi:putative nucleotidyltransferase with HDIG domain
MVIPRDEITPAVVAKAIESLGEIGSLPEVTTRIIEVVEDSRGTADQLNEVVSHDPALAARILKLVNSAFYGLPGRVSDLRRAIVLLGQATIRDVAISTSVGNMFSVRPAPDLFDARALWKHCIAVALVAKKIARSVGTPARENELFLAGLMHDLGLIVERQTVPKELAEVCRRADAGQGDFLELEQDIIGATHQDFGHALTLKWRFPKNLRDGVSFHHNPETLAGESRLPVSILRCADIFCCRQGYGFELVGRGRDLSPQLLDSVGTTIDHLNEIQEGLDRDIEEAEAVLGLGEP